MIKLVLCDMDLTLVPFRQQTVSPLGLQAIHELMDAGIHVGAASGRGLPDLRRQFAGDERCVRTAVASNGCLVLAEGEIIGYHPLNREQMERMLEAVRKIPDVFFTCDASNARIVVGGTAEEARRRFLGWKGARFVVQDNFPSGDLIKVNLAFGIEAPPAYEVLPALRELASDIDFCVLHEDIADMMPVGVSKATGMQALLNHFALSEDEVLVFGDSENDLPLFRAFKNSVAMGNATREIRGLARWHIGPCTEDACAKALLDLAKATREGHLPAWMSAEADRSALERALNDPTISAEHLHELWTTPQDNEATATHQVQPQVKE